ncbi:hypothetical protein GQ53DRAFT_125998 [Thozetella sp. PMI_491]|nr:hypothetical protein GQ53DRAFT_125998 [Thozetella sp. PMI_491]
MAQTYDPSRIHKVSADQMSYIKSRCESLSAEAVSLVQQAWMGYNAGCGAGFMSCAIYDTAWASMVAKITNGKKHWVFPESFDDLLRTQSDDGSWGVATPAWRIDGILNTVASLLSL